MMKSVHGFKYIHTLKTQPQRHARSKGSTLALIHINFIPQRRQPRANHLNDNGRLDPRFPAPLLLSSGWLAADVIFGQQRGLGKAQHMSLFCDNLCR